MIAFHFIELSGTISFLVTILMYEDRATPQCFNWDESYVMLYCIARRRFLPKTIFPVSTWVLNRWGERISYILSPFACVPWPWSSACIRWSLTNVTADGDHLDIFTSACDYRHFHLSVWLSGHFHLSVWLSGRFRPCLWTCVFSACLFIFLLLDTLSTQLCDL